MLFEENMLGILQLNEYRTHLSKSLIISGIQSFQLIKFLLTDQFTLLYRGSRYGFGAQDFHSKCNGHSSTSSVDPYICDCKPDRTAFIFCLVNSFNKPCKMKILSEKIKHAITCLPDCGPLFG